MSGEEKHTAKVYGKGVIHLLDKTGDAEVAWDLSDEESVESAENWFNEIMKIEGMHAYEIETDEAGKSTGKKLERFDKNAAKIIITPRFAGG